MRQVPHKSSSINLMQSTKLERPQERIEFLSSALAKLLGIKKVFNEEFVNEELCVSPFCSSLIDDVEQNALCFQYLQIFSEELNDELFKRLHLMVRGKSHGLHSCFLAVCHCDYAYGRGTARRNQPPEYLRVVMAINSELFLGSDTYYDAVHVNFFLKRSSLGMHADNETILGNQPNILSLSLGACRNFAMTNIGTGDTKEFLLGHGHIVQMVGNLQSKYLHGVPKMQRCGDRINLTFRRIKHHRCAGTQRAHIMDTPAAPLFDLEPGRIHWYAS